MLTTRPLLVAGGARGIHQRNGACSEVARLRTSRGVRGAKRRALCRSLRD